MIQVIPYVTSWLARSLFSEVARQLRAFITPCLASFLSLSFFSRRAVSLPPANYVIILTHNKTESSHVFACNTRKRCLCGKSTAWPRSVVQFSVCRNGPVTFRMSVCLSVCLSACLPVCLPACLPVCLSVSMHHWRLAGGLPRGLVQGCW